MHVLGIDAGGSKTLCLLADESGTILAEARGPGANLQAAGEPAVERILGDVIATAIGERSAPAAVCVGMAGVDREDEWRSVQTVVRRFAPTSHVLVVNDALIALVAGAGDSPGIVIVAGTGSIVYGRNGNEEAARAGGWGHILGDEGSGYWIGREALMAVMRAADDRGPQTRLTVDVLAHFDINDVSRLPRIVYDREVPRMSVAEVGPLVQRTSLEGDAVARRILERAADELSLGVRSVATRLQMRGDPFVCVLAGGVFKAIPWLAEELPRRLEEVAPRCQVQVLQDEPAVGAVQLALAQARGSAKIPVYKSQTSGGSV
jgi:N-acetylglucosamine kinase-like BadF-type ATPase